jgi:hypothetical protein
LGEVLLSVKILKPQASLSRAPLRLLLGFAILGLFAIPGRSQQILEDWNCASGAVPTAGNPTTFTCSEPHNYVAGTRLAVWNASGGSWANMNTQEQVYLRVNVNATSTQLLVNDTLDLPKTGNFVIGTETQEQILVNVANSDTLNVVTRGYGGTTATPHVLEEQMWGPLSANVSYPITITGANTFTIAFNSSGFGAYAGNPIILQRSSYMYTSTPSPLQNTSVGDGVGEVNIQPAAGHVAYLGMPGCASPSSSNQAGAFECARAFNDPGNQKGYGANGQISTLVVSGGTGTVTLTAPFNYAGQSGNRSLGPNQLVWIEGINEGSNAFNSINRPWIMSAVNGSLTQITIPGMGSAGVADGTYSITNTSPWYGKNFWMTPPLSLYYYFYGDVGNGASFPAGYTQQLIKSGTPFNVLDNRISMSICWGKNVTPFAANTGSLELGNYFALQPSGTAYHGYQSLNINGYANQCGTYTFTADFGHLVGQQNPVYNPNDYAANGSPGYPPYTGENTHHAWEVVNHWYLNGPGLYADYSNQTIQLGQLTMNYVAGEPEEYVLSRGVIYTGSAYEIDLQVNQPGIAAPSYQFRYSTTDLKTAGFSTGLCQSGSTACSGADSVLADNSGNTEFLRYTSANLPTANPMYWGIRPTIPISGTSGSGVSPIWINTDYSPNMQTGDHITIAGLTGNKAANQSNVAITGVYPRTTWWYTNPTPTWPSGASSGQLVSIVSNGSVCTVNLTVSHGIQPGWRVVVYSVSTGDATHGYRYTVTGTPTSSSFTYACNSAAGTYASDTAGTYHMAVTAEPGISIAGTGNGNWAGETTGTLVATDDTRNFVEIAYSPTSSPAMSAPGSTSSTFSACDLNQDGVVNVLDVNLAVGAALGTLPCTAKLDGAAQCDVIDVERVVVAALGGACTVGP